MITTVATGGEDNNTGILVIHFHEIDQIHVIIKVGLIIRNLILIQAMADPTVNTVNQHTETDPTREIDGLTHMEDHKPVINGPIPIQIKTIIIITHIETDQNPTIIIGEATHHFIRKTMNTTTIKNIHNTKMTSNGTLTTLQPLSKKDHSNLDQFQT